MKAKKTMSLPLPGKNPTVFSESSAKKKTWNHKETIWWKETVIQLLAVCVTWDGNELVRSHHARATAQPLCGVVELKVASVTSPLSEHPKVIGLLSLK